MKRSTTGLCGLLSVDKPAGMTSHDVVARVRRITGERRVGHAGTLDPEATGLMLVGVGAATRLSQYMLGHDKAYRARIVFGAATDTDDLEGRVIAQSEEAAALLADRNPDEVLRGIVGEQLQLPPAYSAIKKNGVVAYKAARQGEMIELEPRAVTIYSAEFAGAGIVYETLSDAQGNPLSMELPFWDVVLSVSKGTYIRAIARDLGQQLGCGAHIGALRRISIAGERIEDALTLDELEARFSRGDSSLWLDPVALLGFPALHLDANGLDDVTHGRALALNWEDGEAEKASLVSCVAGERLHAVYEREGSKLVPRVVIPGGVCGVK